jgi:hypothetical protein
MHLIGDVKGKVAIMVDDMIDTAGLPSFCRLYVAVIVFILMLSSLTQGQSQVQHLC